MLSVRLVKCYGQVRVSQLNPQKTDKENISIFVYNLKFNQNVKKEKEKEELVEDYLTTDELNDIKQVIQDLNSQNKISRQYFGARTSKKSSWCNKNKTSG